MFMRNGFLIAATVIAAASLSTSASAAVIAKYEFTGNTLSPTVLASNVDASDLTGNGLATTFRAAGTGAILGGNPAPGIGDTYGNVTNRNMTGGASTGAFFGENFAATEADSVANNDYYQIVVQPEAGYTLNLASLTFDFAIGTTGSSNGIAFFVRSDAGGDAFTTTLGRGGTTANAFSSLAPMDLTGAAFQGIDTGDPVTFRIYAYDRGSTSNTTSASAYAGFYFDNLQVSGEVIPEPASFALLGLGGLLMLPRRRRV